MKVLLIHPPAMDIYGRFKPAARLAAQPQMPLGILYIGAVLEEAGHQVSILDGDVDQMGPAELGEYVAEKGPDVVGVSATTPVYAMANRLLKEIKLKCPSAITILGGFHLTALPEATMAESPTDLGIYGEGEETIVELVRALEQGRPAHNISGLLYREDSRLRITPPRPQIESLDRLPLPARHLLRHDRYLWSVPGKGLVPVTTIMTQRGCPFQCVFCGVKTMFPRVQYRAVERVVDELEQIDRELGIHHVQFSDDTLTLQTEKTVAMCQEIRRRKLDLTWEGYTRADRISKDLLRTMKNAGLVRLSFGVESGDQRILEAVKKGTTLEQYRQAYEWCRELSLETRCSVMLGHPFETAETVKKTIDFVCSLPIDQAYINIATPYPGTALLEMARQGYGGLRLLTEDWAEYRRYGNAVMEMNDLSRRDLIRLQRAAYFRFYLRPQIAWRNIKRAGLRAAVLNMAGFASSLLKPGAFIAVDREDAYHDDAADCIS
jgi:anaerobic magnesium-protoporphyrin IX monomethyl ester cyclase